LFGIRENCHSSGRNLIIMPIYEKGDITVTDCSNCRGISPTAYNIIFNIVSKLTSYVDKIIGDHEGLF
jgi:hypothetical protein